MLIDDQLTTADPAPCVSTLLLSARDLARELAVSRSTIWRWHAAGKLPLPIKVGRAVRWSRDAIVRWISMGSPDRSTFEAAIKAVRPAVKRSDYE
jgi:excisionase family DNA binding protein